MIYFDNAATSFPKPSSVYKEINFCLKKCSGNPGRSGHELSVAAAEKLLEARESIAAHFGCDSPENVVLTLNATYALNIAIRAKVKPGSHVITSDLEHNAVMRPLELMRRECGVEYSVFSSSGNILENIKRLVKPNTAAIISTLASNVIGRKIPLKILSCAAKELGLILIVDASQSAGHEPINLTKTPCDCLCAPGHKGLFGIPGSGFALFSSSCDIAPYIVGGSGTNSQSLNMPQLLPEALEAGTMPTPAAASVHAGIAFIDKISIDAIAYKELMLSESIKSGLSVIKDVKLYESHGSIVLFNIEGVSESCTCRVLDKYGICVRGGLHCAPTAHRLIGTESTGAVRVSLSYFNTKRDVDEFLKTIKKIKAEI